MSQSPSHIVNRATGELLDRITIEAIEEVELDSPVSTSDGCKSEYCSTSLDDIYLLLKMQRRHARTERIAFVLHFQRMKPMQIKLWGVRWK